jgi:probable selenium-dependent hydroxylase accessory protein YqeC
MFVLAEELRQAKQRVITSTTTKIWQHQARNSPYVALVQSDSSWRDALRNELQAHGHVFLAHSLLESGKVEGVNPSLADGLYQDKEVDYLIVEADGSAGHPVKAPAKHEPVIPPSTTKVVGMLGLEALGQELNPEMVFRMDLFCKLAKMEERERLTASVLSRLFLHPEGLFKGTPISAKRVAFLNKLDLISEEEEARKLADLILGDKDSRVDRVVMGSIIKGIYKIIG